MSKTHQRFFYLFGFAMLVGSVFLSFNQQYSNQQNDNNKSVLADVTCPASTSAFFINQIEPTRLEFKYNAETLSGISRVDFVLTEDSSGTGGGEKVIGKGVRDTANAQVWRMIWDTRYYKPITTAMAGRVRATVHFIDTSSCATPFSTIFSIPPNGIPVSEPIDVTMIIDGNINPPQWSSLVYASTTINADFPNLTPDLHPYVIIAWQPQIGYVASPFARNTTFNTGPNNGSGKLKLTAIYSNNYLQREADIVVYSPTTETTSGSSTSSSGSTTTTTSSSGSGSETNRVEDEPLPEIKEDAELDEIITLLAPTTVEPSQLKSPSRALALVLQSNEEIKTCISNQAGSSTIETILREDRRPRSQEFNKFVNCFSSQKNVIPSIIAPVAPEDVKTRKESKNIAIRSITNAKKTDSEDSKEKTTLVLSGSATANTYVLLYVFSEPLVLATTTDDEGNWSYSLEDPIDPGDHEVYAMVDRGDGEYERSSVANFFIGTAEASEDNPDGLSLELVGEPTVTASNRSTTIYIVVTFAVIAFGAITTAMFAGIMTRKRRVAAALQAQSMDQGMNQNMNQPVNDESNYKSFIDQQ